MSEHAYNESDRAELCLASLEGLPTELLADIVRDNRMFAIAAQEYRARRGLGPLPSGPTSALAGIHQHIRAWHAANPHLWEKEEG